MPISLIIFYVGTEPMKKLRNSICGKDGKNLDDLDHMTGMSKKQIFAHIIYVPFYRVLSYWRY